MRSWSAAGTDDRVASNQFEVNKRKVGSFPAKRHVSGNSFPERDTDISRGSPFSVGEHGRVRPGAKVGLNGRGSRKVRARRS